MFRAQAFLLGALFTAAIAYADEPRPSDMPAAVGVRDTGAGRYFTNAKGLTLYVYERDTTPGQSSCVGKCAQSWPPFLAAPNAKAAGDWSLIAREDGSSQWAYQGKPLYTYISDTHPGNTFAEAVVVPGDNVGSGAGLPWRAAFAPIFTPPEAGMKVTAKGRVLTDRSGMTLYVFDGDSKFGSAPACTGDCLSKWQPLVAPAIANPIGDWSVIPRVEGKKQWGFRGKPLYTYRDEIKAGDIGGDGRDGKWQVALLEPVPSSPPWVAAEDSDLGRVLTDARGMVLYIAPDAGSWSFAKMLRTTCKQDCVQAHWQPVLVAVGEPDSIGNWTAVTRDDGAKQWAFEGNPVYIFKDGKPHDVVHGEHYGGGMTQQAGFRAIEQVWLMR